MVVTAVLILKYEGFSEAVDFVYFNFSHTFSGVGRYSVFGLAGRMGAKPSAKA